MRFSLFRSDEDVIKLTFNLGHEFLSLFGPDEDVRLPSTSIMSYWFRSSMILS
ncbi:hypothetical protein GIB67_016637 [Kingdonia uniflora]|uniref:Uncharacterized protein n=1 Tax=Kingdonia uniflora TaxID=39325 RepID=A0A7J7MZ42_9MAGN|nr:hypothetical protein GIB67_016637 [Kingdonia uniflora]